MKDNVAEDLTEREIRDLRKQVDNDENNKIEIDELILVYKILM